MSAVLFQHRPAELEALLAERHAKGLDIRDEVWEGVYVVMAPSPSIRHEWIAAQLIEIFGPRARAIGLRAIATANIGVLDDYRIPDVVVFDRGDADPTGVWISTAALVVEIRSPGEAHERKL